MLSTTPSGLPFCTVPPRGAVLLPQESVHFDRDPWEAGSASTQNLLLQYCVWPLHKASESSCRKVSSVRCRRRLGLFLRHSHRPVATFGEISRAAWMELTSCLVINNCTRLNHEDGSPRSPKTHGFPPLLGAGLCACFPPSVRQLLPCSTVEWIWQGMASGTYPRLLPQQGRSETVPIHRATAAALDK
ncbi:hypothetical protein PsYK624_085700 [Phanerochaete sordida]|uniref:Uncharacterized protein n=1 Tax=Phanerochaete sordida TaxID=48140 RepID=A0A9P3GCT9_9APHY|nr:hypothetical protein PsYK624_085700 [Phanerochaete sordida]